MTKKHTKADYFRTSRKNKMAATLLLTTGLVAASTMPALAADEDNNAEPAATVAPSVVTPVAPVDGTLTVTQDTQTSEDGNTITSTTTNVYPDATRPADVPDGYTIPDATLDGSVTKTNGTDENGNATVTTVDTTTSTGTVNLVNKTTEYTEETSPEKNDEKYLKEETVKRDVNTTVVTTITAVETTIGADNVPAFADATSQEQGGTASDVMTAEDGSKSITVTMPDGTVYTYQVIETTVSGPAVTEQSTLAEKTQAFLDSLKVTGNFAVYADTLNENGHIDGNIAVNELTTNGEVDWSKTYWDNTIGAQHYVYKPSSNVEGLKRQGMDAEGLDNYSIIIDGNELHYGYVNDGMVIVSGGALSAQLNTPSKLIDLTNELNGKTDAEKQQIIANAVAEACGVSADRVKQEADISGNLAAIANVAGILNQTNVELSGLEGVKQAKNLLAAEKTICISVTPDVMNGLGSDDQTVFVRAMEDLLRTNKEIGATIIMNVDTTNAESITIKQPLNNPDSEHGASSSYTIWNFGDYNGNIVFSTNGRMIGVIVAPNATVQNSRPVDGRIIAQTVEQGSWQAIFQPNVGKQGLPEGGTTTTTTYTAQSGEKVEITAETTTTVKVIDTTIKTYAPVTPASEEPGTPGGDPEDTTGGGTTPGGDSTSDGGDTPGNNNNNTTTTTIDDESVPQGDSPAAAPQDSETIDDDPVPLADAADDSADDPQDNEEINDNPVPQARAFVQSGDNAQTAGFAGMLMAALAGLFATRRKFN